MTPTALCSYSIHLELETLDLDTALSELERILLGLALDQSGGNLAGAGRLLGRHRNRVRARCRRLGVPLPSEST